MPRGPRLDTPGALHHVIARGINQQPIFRDDSDRLNLVARIGEVLKYQAGVIYAWVFMANHFHLLLRTLKADLSTIMRRLMTGHAVAFNNRHRRSGHLFQNRYWSCLVEDDKYFETLVAYIHLNPVQTGPCIALGDLERYPWSGHAGLLGGLCQPWFDAESILGRFGRTSALAREAYFFQIEDFLRNRKREDFSGGGLIRSMGGRSEFLRNGRGRDRWAHDERVLGSSEFVERIMREIEMQAVESEIQQPFLELVEQAIPGVAYRHGLTVAQLTTGSRRRCVVKARNELVVEVSMRPGFRVIQLARRLNIAPKTIYRILATAKESA